MAKKIDIEKNLQRLEELVHGLESGELTLDDSLKNFEEGVKLYTDSKGYLEKVEKKVLELTDKLEEKEIE
ncbi:MULTISPECIES: exodeoxyribonuclease VII small subunit [Halobacteriovorax]|uniref:exodeoxyribonuclease VII small subunit n=1 Tax=Halobacteriovorax TaxID=1652133 RepID=UPI000EB725BB|nr:MULTISPECIES: exodeoxyribonuclease VII small subunit [Halobacteriovorax]AYF45930.1 exodeoxyribonuclease VII, small subunit [Halobacteriovorax sp. BALOs_7]